MQAVIDRLNFVPAWGTPNEISDHVHRQLRLVIQPTNARALAVRTRIGGKTVKITLRTLDIAAAREQTRKLLAEVEAGRDPRLERRRLKADRVGGAMELYLSAALLRPKTRVEFGRYLLRYSALLHGRPLAETHTREVNALLVEIAASRGKIVANRARTALSTFFAWAVEQELVDANPVAAARRPQKREPSRDRVLSPRERQLIWAATAGGSRHDLIVRLLLLLGLRRQEVGGMRWSELDMDRGLWLLPPERTKTNRPHLVPLPLFALEVIAAQPRRGDDVFGKFTSWVYAKRVLDARLPADIPPWVLHDIRRSFVSALNEELHVPPHVVEACVGHLSGDAKRGVAGVYNRALYIEERRRALERWADHLLGRSSSSVLAFPAASAS